MKKVTPNKQNSIKLQAGFSVQFFATDELTTVELGLPRISTS
jgi:hypothetical protein